jgi:hypothetical protein
MRTEGSMNERKVITKTVMKSSLGCAAGPMLHVRRRPPVS